AETKTAGAVTRPRVRLLGPLEITARRRGRRRAPGPAHELIAYLVLRPEGASRDELLEALWPNDNPTRSEQRFWQASKEARKLLDDGIVRESGRYSLDRRQVDVDADQLERLLAETDACTNELAQHQLLEQALALFRGPPLEGCDYLWAEGARRRLAARHLELLARVAHARLLVGDASGALDAAEQGIAVDSLNEGFWQIALEAEGALGNREAVAERYDRLCRLLDERLGLEPDRQTRATHRRLLGQA
ncbi:MAG: AfsR/SARP family transcriptional regulator, partial [Gaiellaceae bacterium]